MHIKILKLTIPVYLTKTILKMTSNAIFNMKIDEPCWTSKLQVITFRWKKLCSHTFKSSLEEVFDFCELFNNTYFLEDLQKQPHRGVLSKGCSENMQQIYRTTPMSKCDFNEVAALLLDLQASSSETPVWGYFFNKVASLTEWRLLTMLEGEYCQVFLCELEIFWKAFLQNT